MKRFKAHIAVIACSVVVAAVLMAAAAYTYTVFPAVKIGDESVATTPINRLWVGSTSIDSGAATKTVTLTGMASGDVVLTNVQTAGINQYVKSAVAGSGSFLITLDGTADTTSTIAYVVIRQAP